MLDPMIPAGNWYNTALNVKAVATTDPKFYEMWASFWKEHQPSFGMMGLEQRGGKQGEQVHWGERTA